MCNPYFDHGDLSFAAPNYPEEHIKWLETRILLNPTSELKEDPYSHPEKWVYDDTQLCGVVFQDTNKETYRLETLNSSEEIEQADAYLTHRGACSHCSSLQSLALYIKDTDLTGPTRRCGIVGMFFGQRVAMKCLMNIGFDRPCAKVSYYNVNTRKKCLSKFLDNFFGAIYHNPDGSLRSCIQCDEEKSGPVFRAAAENSGIPAALCRPCTSIEPITHWYGQQSSYYLPSQASTRLRQPGGKVERLRSKSPAAFNMLLSLRGCRQTRASSA